MGVRLVTGVSYIAFLTVFYLLKIFVSDLCFDAAIWLFSLIGTFEMLRAFGAIGSKDRLKDGKESASFDEKNKPTKAQTVGVFVFAAICVPLCALCEYYFGNGAAAAGGAFLVLCLYLLSLLVARHEETDIGNTGAALFSAAYPTLLLALLTLTNHLHSSETLAKFAFNSDLAILSVFVISPFADSLAYVFGRFMKKKFPKKLAPVVSPNKTVIGGIGGLVGGLVGAAILYFSYNAVVGSFDRVVLILPLYLSVGLLSAIATEFGDLVESCVKRKVGIKDMGRLLPGHGGVMDRIDGTMFAAVAVYLIFKIALAI